LIPVVKRINYLLKSGNVNQLKSLIQSTHPYDVAVGISTFRPQQIMYILETLGDSRALEIFQELEPDTQKACLEYADPKQVLHFFEALSPDDQADLVKILGPELKDKLLALLKQSDREDLIRLSRHAEGTAGAEMTTEFFALPSKLTVQEALEQIKEQPDRAETVYSIYITSPTGRLRGVVSLKDLVISKPEKTLKEIMNPNVISVLSSDVIQYVYEKISKYDLIALPVVNSDKILIGIITVDDIIDVIEEEVTEDIYAMGAAGTPIDYVNSNVFSIARQRITWLLALVLSGIFAGFVMQIFQNQLAAYVQLAFFIPLLTGSGGNAGTQTTTVIVRGLATGELTTSLLIQILWKEIRVGVVVGSMMGTLAGVRAYLISHDIYFTLTIGLSMIIVVTMAKTIGSILPIIFKKMNLDPALMSGPLLSSLVDIFSLFIYFGLAIAFLPAI